MAVVADFGTTWTKWLDTETGERRVLATRNAHGLRADIATGHTARRRAARHVNELIAMAQGGGRMVSEPEFLVVDVGSRDVKYIHMRDGELVGMDWTATCGALTGFTLELLGRYFELDYDVIEPAETSVPVTCGVLGMEQLFELVSQGVSEAEAVARFARGIAMNAYRFIGEPERFYLSGGMCENRLFRRSFPATAEVRALGRFVLVEGLLAELEREGAPQG
jgi:activator of 2-hydroxyglutaryl-CoA dehydratase